MFESGVIDYVDEFYIEWHQRLVKGDCNEHKLISDILAKGIRLNPWY